MLTADTHVRLTKGFITGLVLLSALALQGCGSEESGLAGYYDVVSHTRHAPSCEGPGLQVGSSSAGDERDQLNNPFPDFVRLDDVPFAGKTALRARGCASLYDNECTGFLSLELSLGLGPIDDGWGSDAVGGPTGSKDSCTFSYSGTRIVSIDGKTVEIRSAWAPAPSRPAISTTPCTSRVAPCPARASRPSPCASASRHAGAGLWPRR